MDRTEEALAGELRLDMIPDERYRCIAEEIGVDNLLKLAEIVGGTRFYMPKAESFLRPVRDEHIRAEFDGYNHAALAIKYNVTDRWVRKLCGNGQVLGQQALDDYLAEAE